MPPEALTRRQILTGTAGLLPRCASAFAAPGSAVSLSRVPSNGIQPQVAPGSRGVIHAIFYSGDPRAGDLFYVHSRDQARSWSQPIPVNAPGSAVAAGTIRGAQLAVGRKGRVHVAWNGSSKALPSGKPGGAMLYSRLNDSGNGFEPERDLLTVSTGLDGGGSVAADDAGNVYVTWHGIGADEAKADADNEARRQVWVAVSHDDGKSFSPEKKAWQELTGACGCCGMKAFADRAGKLSALYRSARESVHRDVYLLRSTDKGATITGKLLHKWDINACPMSSMDLAESDAGTLAAWETSGQIYWANVARGGPAAAPGEGKNRKHPRLAVNSKGQVLLVWTEGTAWQRGGSLAWQLYDAGGKPTSTSGNLAGIPVWSFAAPVAHADGTFSILY